MSVTLPRAQTVMVDGQGRPTREFYQWFRAVVGGIEGQISDLSNIVQGLVNISKSLGSPEGSTTDIISVVNALSDKVDIARVVTGAWSVRGGGPLSDDVILRLDGDRQDPGISMMYATDENGARGWIPQGIPSFVTTDDVAEGATNLYFTTERAQASARTVVGRTVLTFAYGDASPSNIYVAPNDRMAVMVRVVIDTPFDGAGAALKIGTAASPELLMPAASNDPSAASSYEFTPDEDLNAGDTIQLAITPGSGATQGGGRIILDAYER